MRSRAFVWLVYTIGAIMVVGALLVFMVEPSQGALVALLASMVLSILGSTLAARNRLAALRRQTEREQASAFAPAPETSTRQTQARHPGLGPGLLELGPKVLRFTGTRVQRLGEIGLIGLDLHRASLRQVVRSAFRPWVGRARLRKLAAAPRSLEVRRSDVSACAAFERVNTGPELILGYSAPDTGETRWEALFLARMQPGRFPIPTDDPQAWVTALQPPETAAESARAAAQARRRIHRRLAWAATALAVAAAAIPMLGFIAFLTTIALIDADRAAGLTAVVLAGVWIVTSLIMWLISWWSYR